MGNIRSLLIECRGTTFFILFRLLTQPLYLNNLQCIFTTVVSEYLFICNQPSGIKLGIQGIETLKKKLWKGLQKHTFLLIWLHICYCFNVDHWSLKPSSPSDRHLAYTCVPLRRLSTDSIAGFFLYGQIRVKLPQMFSGTNDAMSPMTNGRVKNRFYLLLISADLTFK